ncbi:MAG TPA: alpha/beta hydrolase [Chloroflexi bacterium]|nr:alpha/beta hydrolase [Chloroflexota bacterium]
MAPATLQAPQPPTPQPSTPQAIPLDPLTGDVYPTPQLERTTRERRQLIFPSGDVALAGELDLPRNKGDAPLVFIIHHSGPVGRNAYGYLAELLTGAGFAVFRFDKRGVGASEGEYGCCEAEDALAAYRAAVAEPDIDRSQVFIVAQSIGSQHLAEHFAQFAAIQPPAGVVLLSSLVGPEEITAIAAPVHIIVADSEPNLAAITTQAVQAHRARWPFGASSYIAADAEHTLFDIKDGPIDWSDPAWVTRYHRGAMQSLIDWLQSRRTTQKGT